MKTSQQGIDLLIAREALRTHAYRDSVGVWTIGVGHTGPEVHEGLVWTEDHCKEVFAEDLAKFEDAVNASVTVPLEQYQFDALTSFTYNVGIGAEAHSTLVRDINAGDFDAATAQFDRWHIPPEIATRRNGERFQFAGTAFYPRCDNAGNPV